MVFTDRVKDITYQDILPSIVDFVNDSNILTARIMTSPKNWKGVTVQQPITIANSTTGGAFDGLDTFDTSATNNTRVMTWYVKAYEQSVVISGIEKAVNEDSQKKALSLIATRMDEAKNSLADGIGDLFYGTGEGKNFDGLGIIVDDGTATSAYAGITRADLPAINADVTAAASGELALALVASEFDEISAAGAKSQSPTMLIGTKAIFSLFESLLGNKLQVHYDATTVNGYNRVSGKTPMGVSVPATELKGATGFVAISYRGTPVVADDKCPDGKLYFLNERYIAFHRLLSSDLKSINMKNEVTDGVYKDVEMPSFLQFRDFMDSINQFGEIGALIVMGNLICNQPRRQGVITGITTASY